MYLDALNENQLKAVKHSAGALFVLAGAGTGKSFTLIAKIKYLIEEVGIFPNNIWAMTFTNKATNEMVERLEKAVGKSVAKRVNIGTIHSIANKIYNGVTPFYLRKKIMVKNMGALSHLYAFLRNNGYSYKDAKSMLGEIGYLRLHGADLNNFSSFRHYQHIEGNISKTYNEVLHIVFNEYEKYKEKRNLMDFNDILIYALKILESPKHKKYVEKLQNSCEYMMQDEAQDGNEIAFKLIKILTAKNKNVMCVGDLKQAIFSFQGSSPENLFRFKKEHNADVIPLNINYRSTKNIVDNANFFMKGAEFVTENDTMLANNNEIGEEIKYLVSCDAIEEAENVFDLIDNLVRFNGYEYRDIKVIYRLHSQSVPLEDLLLLNKVPYITYTEDTFFDRKEIMDIVTYMMLANSPDIAEMKDIIRIANRPLRYIRTKDLNTIAKYADRMEMNYVDALGHVNMVDIPYERRGNILRLYNSIKEIRLMIIKNKDPSYVARHILNDIGYKEWALKEIREKKQDSDVDFNFDAILSFLEPLKSVDEMVARIREFKEMQKKKKDENGNYLKLQTLHSVKGLQSPVVIILGNCTTLYPFHRNDNLEEERRLMYVGITRPEKELYLSIIDGKLGRKQVRPSMYVKMMKKPYKPNLYER